MSILPQHAPLMFGAKRVWDFAKIKLSNEQRGGHLAQFLGRGRFTTAFRLGSQVVLYVFHEDFSKSILAQAYRRFGDTNPHLPKIERIGVYTHRDKRANVYKARYYKPFTMSSLSSANRSLVVSLQEAHDEACNAYKGNVVRANSADAFNAVVARATGLTYLMRSALEGLAFVAQDWGNHYIFDGFKPNNLALDGRNRLVLIDPMFDMEKIQRDFELRQRRVIFSIDNDFS